MNIALSKENEAQILSLVRSGRMPHTIIISGDSKDERDQAALLLASGAVCTGKDAPCMTCLPCKKVREGIHPDVIIPLPSKNLKTGIISLKDLRDNYLSQASIKPNEADIKIYIFYDADKLLREDSQNTLLKVIEEPPQNILFLFTVENIKAMLPTVRSRARVINLHSAYVPDEDTLSAAEELADGIVSLYEYDLLLTLFHLNTKETLEGALAVLYDKLRLALLFESGIATDDVTAKKLARKLNRSRIIGMMDITLEAQRKLKTNVNLQLLNTWLCTQYRRITWQK